MRKLALLAVCWVSVQLGVLVWYTPHSHPRKALEVLVPVSPSEVNRHAAISGWEGYAVRQRHLTTGCIPTGCEFLLRAAHTTGINYDTFQEDFDPGEGSAASFEDVAAAIRARYAHVRLSVRRFKRGADKLQFIDQRLARKQPLIVSLTLSPQGVWHIMPVLGSNSTNLFLLWLVKPDGSMDVRAIRKVDFVFIHDEWPGGDDVAFIETSP